MAPYVLVERGEHVTRKGRFPFVHFFKEAGPFYNVSTSNVEDAAKFGTRAAARRCQLERGLTRHKIECLPREAA